MFHRLGLLLAIVFMLAACSDVQFEKTGEAQSKAEPGPLVDDVVKEGDGQDVDDVDDVDDIVKDDDHIAKDDDKDCDKKKRGKRGKRGPAIADIDDEILDQYACDENGKTVRICHIPPGNYAARHSICIGRPALTAHQTKHSHTATIIDIDQDMAVDVVVSDYLGECVENDIELARESDIGDSEQLKTMDQRLRF